MKREGKAPLLRVSIARMLVSKASLPSARARIVG
jgi:hypothetical protein